MSGRLVGTGEPEMLNGIVSYDGSIFDVLKVPALIGRAFTAEAADPSADDDPSPGLGTNASVCLDGCSSIFLEVHHPV